MPTVAPRAQQQPTPAEVPFQWPPGWPLLSAEWRDLVMLNYEVDPAVVAPLAPAGTELDFDRGKTYLSVVGFEFRRTRFMGVAVPFHTRFPEVNLRFYIRRRAGDQWRRGVAFVRELAPRRAVSIVANCCYGERYLTVPMWRKIEGGGASDAGDELAPRRIEYGWRDRRRAGRVAAETDGGPSRRPAPGSHEEFIIEHYWGYSSPARGGAKEYSVAHRPWRISPATSAELDCDAQALYGASLAEFLCGPPASAFWVDGSAVRVYCGRRIP
jgi:hypothetical protein